MAFRIAEAEAEAEAELYVDEPTATEKAEARTKAEPQKDPAIAKERLG